MPLTHDRFTSADVLEMNNSEEVFGVFNEASQHIPEIRLIAASPCKKTVYKTLALTELPNVGFRESNTGIKQSAPTVEARDVVLKFLDAGWSLDTKVAAEAEWGKSAAITLQALAAMQAALQKIAKQTWYGTAADATGFTGLGTILAKSNHPMVVNAGGTTAGAASSIFAIRTELQGVQYAWGQDGAMDVGPITEAEQWDGTMKKFWAYVQKVQAYIGLQVPSTQVIGRVCNITRGSDGTVSIESRIAELLEKFKVGKEPNLIFMSKRTLEMMRSKRVATTETGREVPYPESIFGIPIHVTEAISNTEALLTT